MFAFTPIQGYRSPNTVSEAEYLDAITRRAAYNLAEAHARVQAMQQQRRRTAVEDQLLSLGPLGFNDEPPYVSVRAPSPTVTLEDLARQREVEMEFARRQRELDLVRQREIQRIRAAAHEAAAQRHREREQVLAERRRQAHIARESHARSAREHQDAVLALLNLFPSVGGSSATTRKPTAVASSTARAIPLSIPVATPVSIAQPVPAPAPKPIDREREQALAERRRQVQAARECHARFAREQQDAVLTLLDLFAPRGGSSASTLQPAAPAPPTTRSVPVKVPVAVPVSVSEPEPAPQPVDHKGKGKAVDEPITVPVPAPQPQQEMGFKEELEARIRAETDPDVQESLLLLYTDIFAPHQQPQRVPSHPVAGPSGLSGEKRVRFSVPVEGPARTKVTMHPDTSTPKSTSEPATAALNTSVKLEANNIEDSTTAPKSELKAEAVPKGADLHRTPALPPAIAAKLLKFYHARRARRVSLAAIQDVEDALRALEGAFAFPEKLDFDSSPSPSPSSSLVPDTPANQESEAGPLAYTLNNTPVHAYEHALNTLLNRLDAVESNGDLEVRGRRKEVVGLVEKALDVVERRVEEERSRSRSQSPVREQNEVVEAGTETAEKDATAGAVALEASPDLVETLQTSVDDEPASEPTSGLESDIVEEFTTHPDEDVSASPAIATETTTAASNPTDFVEETSLAPDESLPEPESPAFDGVVPVVAEVAVAVPLAEQTKEDVVDAAPASPQSESESEVEGLAITTIADITSDTPVEEPAVVDSALEISASRTPALMSPTLPAPEAISRVASSATDATFATAPTQVELEVDAEESVPPSATNNATFFTAEPTPAPSAPMSPASPLSPSEFPSTASPSLTRAEDTFLLTSHPLADGEPKSKKTTASSDEDEIDIISKDELEGARNDSDWSDIESDSA